MIPLFAEQVDPALGFAHIISFQSEWNWNKVVTEKGGIPQGESHQAPI